MTRLVRSVVFRVLSIVAVLLATAGITAAAERDVVRAFPAPPECTVRVDTFRGAITITEADTAEVHVAVHLEIGADTEAETQRLLSGLQLDITREGAAIVVRARDPEQTGARFVWNEKKQIEPTYRIRVPRVCNLDLRTRLGSITVGNVSGALRAHSDEGFVFFRTVSGTVDASSGAGDVVVSRCIGSLNAQTANGVIRVGTVTGRCELKNLNGNVEVLAAKADLRVFAEAGTASVGLPRDFNGHAEVSTSGGSIVASVDPAADCDIDARASLFAHVVSRLPLRVRNGASGSRHVRGTLNGGHARLVLRASGGDVTLLNRPPALE